MVVSGIADRRVCFRGCRKAQMERRGRCRRLYLNKCDWCVCRRMCVENRKSHRPPGGVAIPACPSRRLANPHHLPHRPWLSVAEHFENDDVIGVRGSKGALRTLRRKPSSSAITPLDICWYSPSSIKAADFSFLHNFATQKSPSMPSPFPCKLGMPSTHCFIDFDSSRFRIPDNYERDGEPCHPNLGLHTAAAIGDVSSATIALENGQPPNSILNGVLPLHAACSSGNEDMVNLLLDRGAEINAGRLPATLREAPGMGTIGSTALHFAAANGHTAVVRILLKRGACATVKDRDGMKPDLLAVANNHWATASYIRAWVRKNRTDHPRSSMESDDDSLSSSYLDSRITAPPVRLRSSFDHLSVAAAGVRATIKKHTLARMSSNPSLSSSVQVDDVKRPPPPITIPKDLPYRANGLLSPTSTTAKHTLQDRMPRRPSLPNFTHRRSKSSGSPSEALGIPWITARSFTPSDAILVTTQRTVHSTIDPHDLPALSPRSLAPQPPQDGVYEKSLSINNVKGSGAIVRPHLSSSLTSSFLVLSDDCTDPDSEVASPTEKQPSVPREGQAIAPCTVPSHRCRPGPYIIPAAGVDDLQEYLHDNHVRPTFPRKHSATSDGSKRIPRKPVPIIAPDSTFLSVSKAQKKTTESHMMSSNSIPLFSSTQCSLRSPTTSCRSRTTSIPSTVSSCSTTLPLKTSQDHAQAIIRSAEHGVPMLGQDGRPMTLAQMLAAYGSALQEERAALLTSPKSGRQLDSTNASTTSLPTGEETIAKVDRKKIVELRAPLLQEVKRRSHSLANPAQPAPSRDASGFSADLNGVSKPEALRRRSLTAHPSRATGSSSMPFDPDSSMFDRYLHASDSTFNELRPGDWYGDLSELPGIPKNCSVSTLSRSFSVTLDKMDTSRQSGAPLTPTCQSSSNSRFASCLEQMQGNTPHSPVSWSNSPSKGFSSPSQSRWAAWSVKKNKSIATIKGPREGHQRWQSQWQDRRMPSEFSHLRSFSGPSLEVDMDVNIHSDGKGVVRTFIDGLRGGMIR